MSIQNLMAIHGDIPFWNKVVDRPTFWPALPFLEPGHFGENDDTTRDAVLAMALPACLLPCYYCMRIGWVYVCVFWHLSLQLKSKPLFWHQLFKESGWGSSLVDFDCLTAIRGKPAMRCSGNNSKEGVRTKTCFAHQWSCGIQSFQSCGTQTTCATKSYCLSWSSS